MYINSNNIARKYLLFLQITDYCSDINYLIGKFLIKVCITPKWQAFGINI